MYNLLLVDDEPLIKVAFQSAVEWGKNGFLLAATASNGQEALHIVETQHIDAVITDLKMPGMDGLALIHELKKRSFTGPILVLSNYSDFDSVRTALTDGAYDYFLKINMNGESIGEHLEKMADLLRVQQQRQMLGVADPHQGDGFLDAQGLQSQRFIQDIPQLGAVRRAFAAQGFSNRLSVQPEGQRIRGHADHPCRQK